MKQPIAKSPIQLSTSKKHPEKGFALLVALGLMSFVVLLMLSLSTFVRVNTAVASAQTEVSLAKQNALLALNMAIGKLQSEMGPDKRISAPAAILDTNPDTEIIDDIAQPQWTGVWNSAAPFNKENFPLPLVSNNSASSDGKPDAFRSWLVSLPANLDLNEKELINYVIEFNPNSRDNVLVVGDGTLGDESDDSDRVYVPKQKIFDNKNNETGSYAYWVGDEGTKAKVAPASVINSDNDLESIQSTTVTSHSNISAIDETFEDIDTGNLDSKLFSLKSAELALEKIGIQPNAFKKEYHDLSLYSSGLLIDPRNGGLKKDLSLLFSLDELPPEYNEEPMFYMDSAIGPIWNYAYRYHNWYKRLNVEDDYYYFKTSDFWEEADHQLHDPQDIKYNDLPLPVMAKAQMVFSLWYGMNSYNGKEPEEELLRAATPARGREGTRGYRPAREAVYRQNPFNGQSKDNIFYIMMTPYFYFWNPYNVPIVFDDHPQNQGSFELFFTPPDIEVSVEVGEGTYTDLDRKQTDEGVDMRGQSVFQFGGGDEIAAISASPQSRVARVTNTDQKITIMPGEFSLQVMRPATIGGQIPGDAEYKRMLFFSAGAENLWGADINEKLVNLGGDVNGLKERDRNDIEAMREYDRAVWYQGVVANWVELYNVTPTQTEHGDFIGYFSPITNNLPGTINQSNGNTNQWQRKKQYVEGQTEGTFKIKLATDDAQKKNAFDFQIRTSMGAGFVQNNPSYTFSTPRWDRRIVGAMNMASEEARTLQPHHKSVAEIYFDRVSQLQNPDTEEFLGLKNNANDVLVLNFDIRCFSESGTLGKHALWVDPTNTYYFDNDPSDTTLALSPFRFYATRENPNDLVYFDPYTNKIALKTNKGQVNEETIRSSIAKEIPVSPLLSLCQFDHAPLGRDYDHFAYDYGRKDLGRDGNARNYWESYDLTEAGRHSWLPNSTDFRGQDLIFNNKTDRKSAPVFNNAVGNSYAHPHIPLDSITDPDPDYEGHAVDRSFLLNNLLFDSFYLTGLAKPAGPFQDEMKSITDSLSDWVENKGFLPNKHYKFSLPSSMTLNKALDELGVYNPSPISIFEKIAAFIAVDGAFNINSTSVDAWTAQLASLRGANVLYKDHESQNMLFDENTESFTPVLSQAVPAHKSLESTGGNIDDITLKSWSHFRSLKDYQVRLLAEEIVKQVKIRGPFLSLAEFFNREISARRPYNEKGAVQLAIDKSKINYESDERSVDIALKNRFFSNPPDKSWLAGTDFDSIEVFQGDSNEGLPGYINQSSLLRPLAPILSARSDTFTIRAYGDVVKDNKVVAKAWCEAVVQRKIDYVKSSEKLLPWENSNSNQLVENLGRKFEIVGFRWLNENEV
jgi:hypothetical protein